MKQELADAAEARKNDLNFNVERWKNRFLYPYGDIQPLPDSDEHMVGMEDVDNLCKFQYFSMWKLK